MKRLKTLIKRTSITATIFLFSTSFALASDTAWYEKNQAVLNNNDVVESGVRWLEWNIIELLCMLAYAT